MAVSILVGRKRSMRKRFEYAVTLTLAALYLAGCDSDNDSTMAPVVTATHTPPPSATPTPTCPSEAPFPVDDGQFGAEMPSDEQLAEYTKCLPPAAFAARAGLSPTPPPSASIPMSALPPVQNQGQIPSCEVWSSGYAMGSYTANLTNQQPISDLANTVSPGFLYPWVVNQEGKTCGTGTSPGTTLDYLVANTAPSLLQVPYAPSCTCLDMVDINQTFDTDLHIGSWCSFTPDGATALMAIKGWIAQGQVVQTSIYVPWEFPKYTGGVFDVPTSCPTPPPTPTKPTCAERGSIACIASTTTSSGCAQHGIAIVGYNDNMVGPDGSAGAVLIMNSFGTRWGESGFMWMSYDGFESIAFGGTVAFPPQPSGGLGAPFALHDAFQWVEQRATGQPRTHLIIEPAFTAPIADAEVVITDPEQRTVRHRSVHPFRHGYFYLTRYDGKQFTAGRYAVEIRSTDGTSVTAQATIDLDPASDLPSAPLPDELTGSNGQPAELSVGRATP
jgi:hypothetical protein